jgi:hypothetical protein
MLRLKFRTLAPTLAAPLLALLLYVSSALAQANQLTASVDRDHVGLQETFTLTVNADEKTQETPDFSTLKSDFDILSTSRSQSIRIVNGRTEATTDWHLTLAPKRAGKLLIPSFTIDNAVSDAIEIQVTEQSPMQDASGEQVQAIVEVEKNAVFVQEQLLVKVKLITQVNLSQAEQPTLDLKNALVVNLDEQKQYQTTIGGKPHLVVETSYAVFPQQSGELIIPSLTYTVEVSRSARDLWNDPFGRRGNNLLRLRTEPKKITVKAAPDGSVANNWQPANNLTLNEGWSGSTDNLKVGEPITRTITIMADGLTGNQIAPLSVPQVDGLTFYPDQPQTREEKSANGVQGLRTETMAIIPSHGGSFTLPEINVQWWDNKTQTMKTATLPAKTLNVLGTAPSPIPATQVNTSKASPQPLPLAPVATERSAPGWLWGLIGAMGTVIACLIAYAAKLRSDLYQLQFGQIQGNGRQAETERNLWNHLKQAAEHSDAVALRRHILDWARWQWQPATVHTLDDVARLAGSSELTQALRELDALLYSNHAPGSWSPGHLLQSLSACRSNKKAAGSAEGLQPLYKN